MVSPSAQGRFRGKTEKPSIRHILNELERATGFFDMNIDEYLKVNDDTLKHVPDRVVEEVEAMAEASGYTPDQLKGLNFGKGPRTLFAEGCTAFAIPASHTGGEFPLLMKNRDLGYRRIHPQVHAISRIDGFNEFQGVTTGGNAFWYQGVNEKGLVAFNTATLCGKYQKGVSINILIRRILEECDTVQEAVRLVESSTVSGCSNLFLADPYEVKIVEVKNGYPLHVKDVDKPDARANHYVYHDNPPLTDKDIILHRQYTLTRYTRATQLLKDCETVDTEKLKEFSRDHANGPGSSSICRHASFIGAPLQKLLSSSTLSSQIFTAAPKSGTWFALGRPCQTEFTLHGWGEKVPEEYASGEAWIRNLTQE